MKFPPIVKGLPVIGSALKIMNKDPRDFLLATIRSALSNLPT